MSSSIVTQIDGELRVSSLDVADRTENQHASVLRIVRDNLADFEEFGRVGFEIAPFATAGGVQSREVAQLNEPQATLLITFMRNSEIVIAFKKELVKQFYAMRQALAGTAPKGAELLALAVIEAQTMIAAKDQKIAELAPKADYVDTFVADEDLRILRNVAKSLGMQEAQLRADLVERKWIFHEKSTRWSEKEQKKVPHDRYSAYADKTRYFTPVPAHDAPRFRGEVMHTLKVTPQGAVAIARLYGQRGAIESAAV